MLADTCAGCHGTHGSSVGPASPSIAGISAEYFIESMEAYKNDERPATVMNRIAKGYTEDQLEAMAEYFEEQKYRPAKQAFDAKLAARGKDLHPKYCQEKCHQKGGAGTEDSGVLAGQWAGFLRNALADMREGRSEYPKKMKAGVEKLIEEQGEEALEALMHYYASQQ